MLFPLQTSTPEGKREVSDIRFAIIILGSLAIGFIYYIAGINSIDPEQTGMTLLLQRLAVAVLSTATYIVSGFAIHQFTSSMDRP